MPRRITVAMAVVVMLLSACRAEINARVDLESDGSGKAAVEIGVDEDLKTLIEQSGQSLEESFLEGSEGVFNLPGAQQRTFTRGDLTVVSAEVPFDDINAFAGLVSQDQQDNPLSNLAFTVTEDEASVTGTLDLGDAFNAGDLGDFDPSVLSSFLAFHVQIHLPGKVTTQNADRILDDGTLEWDLPLAGGTLDIQAVSDLSAGGGFPAWAIILIALAVIAVIAIAVMLRKRGAAPPPDAATAVDTAEVAATEATGESAESAGETPVVEAPEGGDPFVPDPEVGP